LWRDILALRRTQCAAPKAEQATLFPLIEDSRPEPSRIAAGVATASPRSWITRTDLSNNIAVAFDPNL
jgi:hypothetical protein